MTVEEKEAALDEKEKRKEEKKQRKLREARFRLTDAKQSLVEGGEEHDVPASMLDGYLHTLDLSKENLEEFDRFQFSEEEIKDTKQVKEKRTKKEKKDNGKTLRKRLDTDGNEE